MVEMQSARLKRADAVRRLSEARDFSRVRLHDIWNIFWSKCLKEAEEDIKENKIKYTEEDISNVATEIFEETANAAQVVGYYIVYHKNQALIDWIANTNGIDFTEQDKQIDAILKELYQ